MFSPKKRVPPLNVEKATPLTGSSVVVGKATVVGAVVEGSTEIKLSPVTPGVPFVTQSFPLPKASPSLVPAAKATVQTGKPQGAVGPTGPAGPHVEVSVFMRSLPSSHHKFELPGWKTMLRGRATLANGQNGIPAHKLTPDGSNLTTCGAEGSEIHTKPPPRVTPIGPTSGPGPKTTGAPSAQFAPSGHEAPRSILTNLGTVIVTTHSLFGGPASKARPTGPQ